MYHELPICWYWNITLNSIPDLKIFFILGDGMTITTVENLSYDHTSYTYTIDGQEVVMAAEVGLLSRKIKIVGHNSPGSSDQETEGNSSQSFLSHRYLS